MLPMIRAALWTPDDETQPEAALEPALAAAPR
jgi:hypothetical protein